MAGSVLLTGCNGFLGQSLSETLRHRGWSVTGALRRLDSAPRDPARSCDQFIAVGDLGPTTDWSRALDGVHCVIHAAAAGSANGLSQRALDAVNVHVTRQLALQAAACGAERFIFVSTIKVHGESSNGLPITEATPCSPAEPYATSKLEAERELVTIQRKTGMTVIIVRPTLLYGPGVRGSFFRMLQAVAQGIPLPFGSLQNRRSMMSVANAADLLSTCVEANVGALEIFVAADPEPLSTPAWVSEMSAALGRRARLFRVEPSLLAGAAQCVGLRGAFTKLCGSLEVNALKVHTQLGWNPPQSRIEALAATANWYRSQDGRSRACGS